MTNKTLPQAQLQQLAATTFLAQYELAYAQLDGNLNLLTTSPNFYRFVDVAPFDEPVSAATNWEGVQISDLFLAFVGAENALRDVLNGKLEGYRLEHVNRALAEDVTGYVSYHVAAATPGQPEAGLLLVIEDSTRIGELRRELIQDRNELRLTQRRLAQTNESLRQLDRLKSLFFSMAAHDLRTPLTSIYGYVDVALQMGGLSPTSRIYHNLEIVLSQARWLNRLIGNLLDLNRIEEGKLTVRPEWTSLHDSVTEVVDALMVRLESNSQQIQFDLPPAPCFVWVDPTKLTQILFNLVGNAIKYTPEGSEFTIAANHENDGLKVSVADNGPGMNSAQVERMFTLYYRTEEAQRQGVSGTGLGLYIVKMLAEAHGGRVGVISELGHGSTFFFWLPLPKDPPLPAPTSD